MRKNKIAAIIIAAGYSSRMDGFKPLLKFNNETAIERLIHTYQCSGIQDIYVVVGHRSDEIVHELKGLKIDFVSNEAYDKGMFSSVIKGILALNQQIDAFFMQPVDIPLIKRSTLKLLKDSFSHSDKGVFYPTFLGQKGHPPLIDCKYNPVILNSDGNGGLKRILEDFEEDSLCVPVFDQSVIMDMDRREDYERLLEYDSQNAPNKEECNAVMKHYQVPDHIIRHCEAVEQAARKIYREIQLKGISLNENALYAAALLHDIVRKEKNHAVAGGNIIREMGYSFVGDIISSHMDIAVREEEPVTEKEILYLADKLVKEDALCNLDERFEQALKDKGDNPEAIEKINKRWLAAKAIMNKMESIDNKRLR
jgi:molybdenum cofactor cytidylyltransferase